VGGCYGRKRLLGGESEDALRLEHGVRHLAFGQVWAELSKYPIVHLLLWNSLPRLLRDTSHNTTSFGH